MAMLAPDLLDRRALGVIAFVDTFGRPLRGRARLASEGVRTYRKDGGHYVVLGAPGLEAHEGAFSLPPAAPAVGSRRYRISVRSDDRGVAPRSFELRLPRDADPQNRETVDSLFRPVVVEMLPTPDCPIPPTAAAVRVTVRAQGDGRRVGRALVRLTSDNGLFAARALTDPRGEALLILPQFPMTFTGPDASTTDVLAATVSVVADPADVELRGENEPTDTPPVAAAYPDPDMLAAIAPPAGTAVQLSRRRVASAFLEWTAA